MASIQVTTSTDALPFAHGRAYAIAGSRHWTCFQDGSGVKAAYSDDAGATWSSLITLTATSSFYPTIVAYQDSGATWHLHIAYAGGNNASATLRARSLHGSKVAAGAAAVGDFAAEVQIDSAGTNLGVSWIHMAVSNTATNPRVWIIGVKVTAASTFETRAWYCATGTSVDTAGNWSTTNFTNLGSNSNAGNQHSGMALSWKVAGADKLTLVFGDPVPTPPRLETVTFDPTAATPTPGTVTAFGAIASGGYDDWFGQAPQIAGNVLNDYLIFGRRDPSGTNRWDFYKTVDGVTWTQPSGWSSITAGRCSITTDGTDFYAIHENAFGAAATTDGTLQYRKITKASDNMGSASTFSDGNGNPVSTPLSTGGGAVYSLYRRGTSSAYSVRTDNVTISAADVTPPGNVSALTAVPQSSGTQINLAFTMPSDADTQNYEIRFLTGATPPAGDRSNGTVIAGPTVSTPNAAVTFNHTSLTGGQVYSYRIFARDATGNWNTGATITATAATVPAFTQRYKADGITTIADGTTEAGEGPVLEFTIAATDFNNTGNPGHLRARVGTDNASPPTQNTFDLWSGGGGGVFSYEDPASSGTFVAWPASGLPAAKQTARKVRIQSPLIGGNVLFVSIRREQ